MGGKTRKAPHITSEPVETIKAAYALILSSRFKKDDPAKGCVVFEKAPTKEGGYSQVDVNGRKYVTHHVVFWATNPTVQPRDGYHVSHRCANTKCINPKHLIYESAIDNQRRKGCPGTIQVKCCCCNHVFNVNTCNHSVEFPCL